MGNQIGPNRKLLFLGSSVGELARCGSEPAPVRALMLLVQLHTTCMRPLCALHALPTSVTSSTSSPTSLVRWLLKGMLRMRSTCSMKCMRHKRDEYVFTCEHDGGVLLTYWCVCSQWKGWRRVHGYRADMQIYNSHITGLCGIGREDKVYRMLDAIYQKSMRLSWTLH